MNFQTGRAYGNYQFIDVLDSSRDGVTYKVRNRLTNRLESMRVMPGNTMDDQDRVERFLREIRVHAGLLHPNIVSFYNAMELEGRLVMTSELVEGVALSERLELGPLPWAEAVSILNQILSALAYAHERCIVHRDLNPSRILLTEGVARINGFNLAKSVADPHLTAMGVVVGSLKYISPEQVKGIDQIDGRSDIYSAGVVLYEALAGKPPFQFKSHFELMSAHVNTMPPPPGKLQPSVPAELDAVVLKAMAKDPNDRFQTATAFRQALEHLVPAREPAAPVKVTAPVAAVAPPEQMAPATAAPAVAERTALPVEAEAPAIQEVVPPSQPRAEVTADAHSPDVKVAAAEVVAEKQPVTEAAPAAPEVAVAATGVASGEKPTSEAVSPVPVVEAAPAAPEVAVVAAAVPAESQPISGVAAAEIVAEKQSAAEAEPTAPEVAVVAAAVAAESQPISDVAAAEVVAESQPAAKPAPAAPPEAAVVAAAVATDEKPISEAVSPAPAVEAAPAAPEVTVVAAAVAADATPVSEAPPPAPVFEVAAPVAAVAPSIAAAHSPAPALAVADTPPASALPATEPAPQVAVPQIAAAAAGSSNGRPHAAAAPAAHVLTPEPPHEETAASRQAGVAGLDLPLFEPIFAPLSAAPVPRELMLAAVFLFLVGIAAFFAFR